MINVPLYNVLISSARAPSVLSGKCFYGLINKEGTDYQKSTTEYETRPGKLKEFRYAKVRVGKKNPQKLIHLSPRHVVGKRTAQKDTIKDNTNDSQVNRCFLYRWSSASLTLNIIFFLSISLFIYNKNNDKQRRTLSLIC